MITLSPRLAAVAALVLPAVPAADIGTDHGYLPAYLVQAGRIPRAIAADIMPGPLEAARATVAAEGLTDRIELRLGPGLQVLTPGEAATATICGMGGSLMVTILAEGPLAGVRRLVLQPNVAEDRVRQWLMENGWRLVTERLVADGGRIYPVMAAEPGQMTLAEGELLVGPHLRQAGGPVLQEYVKRLLAQSVRALAGAQRSHRPESRERAADLERRIRLLKEVLVNANGDHR